MLMLERFALSNDGLVDDVRAEPVRDLANGRRHLERVRAAFQLAGAGDEGHRKRLADADGSARGRDFNDAVGGEVQAVCHGGLLWALRPFWARHMVLGPIWRH